jgi:hypothetical protein
MAWRGDSNLADGFAMPRILPDQRRRGFGGTVLRWLLDHHVAVGHRTVSSAAEDEVAVAFAAHHGLVEVDRQVEQVRAIARDEPEPSPYVGVEFTTVAADPDLLRRAFRIAEQGFADLALATGFETRRPCRAARSWPSPMARSSAMPG